MRIYILWFFTFLKKNLKDYEPFFDKISVSFTFKDIPYYRCNTGFILSFSPKEVRKVKTCGENAILFTGDYSYSKFMSEQYIFNHNGKKALFEFRSAKQDFKNYEPFFDEIVKSFRFKG